MNILTKASELLQNRKSFALATVISSKGSTPRSTASKMIIMEDGSIYDTIGGGIVEAKVIKLGKEAIKEGKPIVVNYRLNSDSKDGLNMQCGGDMDIFIDVFTRSPHLIIVGGGHIGLALSKIIQTVGWEYSVIEERNDYSNPNRFLSARNIYNKGDIDTLEKLDVDENTYIVIVTKDHDKESLKKAICKNAKYIGMIGSSRKVAIVKQELLEEGISEELLEKIHAPIGLDIGAETPEEIAISIVAEMIMFSRGGSGKTMKSLR